MGLFRKITSVSTAGAVDFRSDKERIAKYTKASKKQLQQQTAIMRQQQAVQAAWHRDPYGPPGMLRWWDGYRWTEHVRPV